MKIMRKGFTLVEVMVVVIIIAILAALIVPRMLAQPDKARAAEALQMAGIIKRGAEMSYDRRGSFPPNPVATRPGSVEYGSWAPLGLSGLENSKDWRYSYVSFGNYFQLVVYYYPGGGAWDASYQMEYYGYESGGTSYWNCYAGFKPRVADVLGFPTRSTLGCTV